MLPFQGILIFLFIIFFILSVGFISIQPIGLIALLISMISIVYYLYLSLSKKEFINWNLIIIQSVYSIKMLLVLLPITEQSSIIAKNSLSKEGFNFWGNQLKMVFEGLKGKTLNEECFSLVLYAFFCLLFSYFQLYSSLNLTAQRKIITWKSSLFSVFTLILFILFLVNVENISNWVILLQK